VYLPTPGIDIKDIPNVNDHDFSVTLNGFFLVRWTDSRLILNDVKAKSGSSLSIKLSRLFFVKGTLAIDILVLGTFAGFICREYLLREYLRNDKFCITFHNFGKI